MGQGGSIPVIGRDGTNSLHTTAEKMDRKDKNSTQRTASGLSAARCSGCSHVLTIDKKNILHVFPSSSSELEATCSSCNTITCLGCQQQLSTSTPRFTSTSSWSANFVWHCDSARIVLLWALLCFYEDYMKRNKRLTSLQPTKIVKIEDARSRPSGVGYSEPKYDSSFPPDTVLDVTIDPMMSHVLETISSHTQTVGYEAPPIGSGTHLISSGTQIDGLAPEWSQSKERKRKSEDRFLVDPDDDLLGRVLSALAALLPSVEQQELPSTFDRDPPPSLVHLLRHSSVLDQAADLLRNNSLDDIANRRSLYDSLFDFIRILGKGGPQMSRILRMPRILNKVDLLEMSYSEITRMIHQPETIAQFGKATRASRSEEIAQSLASCALPLIKQTNTIVESVGLYPDDDALEEFRQMLALCKSIAKGLRVLQPADEQAPIRPPDEIASTSQEAVLAVPDEQILNTHHFAEQAAALSNPRAGRMRHILNHIVLLQSSLPPGIFVRYAESRIDLIKILIVGPQGTPYDNGLFEFDLFCPATFPQDPPEMFFRTTGGGRHRLNPNLYADGKICLSILGTWPGEKWEPGKSTILQVLVSIRGMIFCAEPVGNEPGFERWVGTSHSKKYNRELYPKVVKHGMLTWINGSRTPQPIPLPSWWHLITRSEPSDASMKSAQDESSATAASTAKVDVFAEIAKEHFERNREQIKKTVNQWIEEDVQSAEEGDSSKNSPLAAKAVPTTSCTLREFLKRAAVELTKKAMKPIPVAMSTQISAGGWASAASFWSGSPVEGPAISNLEAAQALFGPADTLAPHASPGGSVWTNMEDGGEEGEDDDEEGGQGEGKEDEQR